MLSFAPVVWGDFEAMLAIRVEALRDSLERLGRFDPARARELLMAGFKPEFMRHIVCDGERIGFVTLRPDPAAGPPALHLNHLYLRPAWQGQGVGAWVMAWAKAQAVAQACDIRLSALKHSDANRFYLRQGFVQVGESDFDLDYRWSQSKGVSV